MELGGFAEFEEYIDGDFNAFNYCTAENYINALSLEDFEAVGEIDSYFFENICYWLDYDNSHYNKKIIEQLKNGTLLTVKNRTLIEAIYENKNSILAQIYLDRDLYDPKLLLTILLSDNEFCHALIKENDKEKNDKLFKELFNLIEIGYNQSNNKKEYLKTIKNNINRIRVSQKYDIKPLINNYNWMKQLIKK